PRQGKMITISTAGWAESSPLGLLRSVAHALPSFKRKGMENRASSADGSFVLHEWCLADDDDQSDMKLVERANPAPWHTIQTLRRRYDSPSTTPAQWSRFACGVWTFGEKPWIEPPDWDAMRVDIGGVEAGESVWLHVTAGSSGGIAIAAPRDGGGVAVSAIGTSGDAPLEHFERLVVAASERFDVRECSYDRVEFQRSAELLFARGIPMMEVPHSPERLSIASTTLNRLVQGGQVRHDGDPTLRASVLRGSTKETERGWRFIKTPQTRILIALAIAVHQATQVPAEPPEFIAL
ncbi:MAG: hypothetical protein ACRDIC_10035, partial [bacterium]